MAIVLELLSRKDQTLKYFKFDKSEIVVGRDHHCDLRLEDPYISAEHVRISQDEQSNTIYFEDCQSVNGTLVNKRPLANGKLQGDDILKLGRTRLKVVNTNQPVSAALPLSQLEESLSWLSNSGIAILLTLGYLALSMIFAYVNSIEEYKIFAMLPKEMGQMALLSGWPVMFAVMGKVFNKESRVVSQFSILWLTLFVLYGLYLLGKLISFNFNATESLIWFELIIFTLVLFGFVWLSLFIAFHQTNRRRNIVGAMMTLVIVVPIISIGMLGNGDFSTQPKYDSTMLPPLYQLRSPSDVTSFVEGSTALFSALDKQIAAEQLAQKSDDGVSH
ncbi:MAG: FHA domain-containing protein [Paraglaciecola polaris]|uniref:FHA domain-containing protein n=1 Tax=Paraglaciecola polaris TaxID=222814 RepID=UPI0030023D93|tara:strand:+ start:4234 stop:5229 length:996 start_codon:yes stop_codon:yes gene_type:complete